MAELSPDTSLAELHAKMEALTEQGASAENSTLMEVQRALQRARASLAIVDNQITITYFIYSQKKKRDFLPITSR